MGLIKSKKNRKKKSKVSGYLNGSLIKTKFSRVKDALKDFIYSLEDKKLSPEEVLDNIGTVKQVFMNKPYERPGSYVFFKTLNKGDTNIVIKKISVENKYYIYDKDDKYRTPLHIALKKGYL